MKREQKQEIALMRYGAIAPLIQIRYLKSNYPRMSAAAIFRQLSSNGSIALSQQSGFLIVLIKI